MLLRIPAVRIEAFHLRARAAIAVAARSAQPESLLREAARNAKRIERAKLPHARPLALLVRAGIAAVSNQRDQATGLFADAEESARAADMMLFATVARRCRGQLTGGSQGNALIREADDWMTEQNIRAPARMAALLAPPAQPADDQ